MPQPILLGLVNLALAIGQSAGELTHRAAEASSARTTEAKAAGHARMVEMLERIRVESAEHNPYLGTGAIRDLQSKLAGVREGAHDPRRWQLSDWIGTELLRLGRTDEAIESYTAAVKELDSIRERVAPRDAAETYFHLGTAYMRLGETQNCCLKNNRESCILPIQNGGLHSDKRGSENAVRWFTRALETAKPNSPTYTKSRWLLNVAHMTLDTYPEGVPAKYRIDRGVFASSEPFPRFEDVANDVGLTAVDLAGGVIAEDFDGDGLLDLMVSSSDTKGQLRYYHNAGAAGFVERTQEANLAGLYGGLNTTSADYDGDGDVDVLVLRGAWWLDQGRHPKSLLENDGHGVFTDVTFVAGLGGSLFPSQTASFADYDNDGDLDLYIGNEWSNSARPMPCELYQNDGSGHFADVAADAGVRNERYTKAVIFGDYDGDRFPDIYVSNMASPNRLYHNNGDGTFTDVAKRAGVELPMSSFPCWFFDFDNDGALDIWVGGFGGSGALPSVADVAASYLGLPHNGEKMRLYKGDGRGGFADVAEDQGLSRYTLPMGGNFGDLDNDGYLDMYLGTGYPFYEGLIPNVMYRNRRGKGFADVTTAGGFGHLQKGHGVAFADFDNDGDQDVIERMGGAYPGDGYRCVLFQNPGFGAHWLKIRLVGEESNRFGVGARIRADVVEDGVRRSIYKIVNTGGSFGCNSLRQDLGLGGATKVDKLEVFWPTSGKRDVFRDVAADRSIVIDEASGVLFETPLRKYRFGR